MKLSSRQPVLSKASLDKATLEWLVKDNMSFTLLESAGFIAYLQKIKLMSRPTANKMLLVNNTFIICSFMKLDFTSNSF